MPRRPTATRRWLTALTWPVGVTLTSWDYMWRSTPLHRREVSEPSAPSHLPPEYPAGIENAEVQGADLGRGPLFHRRYRARIRNAELSGSTLMGRLKADLNQAAPTEFARFEKVLGDPDRMAVGDEYVVRMPGPWDGPVRVIADDKRSFRLATLAGHLEAGQIEFRVVPGEPMTFEIESWARSADRFADLLYQRVRMAKEIQLHMWISFLEGIAELADGRLSGGIDIDTRRIDNPFPRVNSDTPERMRRRLAELADKPVNYDPSRLDLDDPPAGWHVDDRCQPLPAESPGEPEPGGSWEIARRLIRGYEFADPSLVRAVYDPDRPLEGREMVLELRALNLVSVHVGVRVVHVYDEERERDGRRARVSGWAYRTLEGHVERGQMDWQVWKWLDDGQVQFRVYSVSRPAPVANPIIRVGFFLLRHHERATFLNSTDRRMRSLTELALERESVGDAVREASPGLTARRLANDDPAHERLARQAERD